MTKLTSTLASPVLYLYITSHREAMFHNQEHEMNTKYFNYKCRSYHSFGEDITSIISSCLKCSPRYELLLCHEVVANSIYNVIRRNKDYPGVNINDTSAME